MSKDNNDTIKDFSRFISTGDPIGINFIGQTVCDEKFYFERTASDIMSLEYILSGSGTLEINGQILHPKKGDVFFLSEGSHHKYYPDKSNPWHKYYFSFCGPFANKIKEFYLPHNTYLFTDCDLFDSFLKIFDCAFDEKMQYEDILNTTTIELMKIMMYIHARKKENNDDLADKIKNKIDYRIEEEFSLDLISYELNYSKNHIINVFSNKFKKTPYQYYINAKIDMAKIYLQETTCSISEIASNLAFSDPQYFSTCFKRATGISPREYRQKPR